MSIQPNLVKERPVMGIHEPLRRNIEPLRRKIEPICGIYIQPLRAIMIIEAVWPTEDPVFKLIQGARVERVAPFSDRASEKAVVNHEQSCVRTINAFNKLGLDPSLAECCIALLNKTPKHTCIITYRSTVRELARLSKVNRCRDREPSRIPVKKIIQTMRRRKVRQKLKSILRKVTPKSSSVYTLVTDYKPWYIDYVHRSDCFFSKFFGRQKHYRFQQITSKIHSCVSTGVSNSFSLGNDQNCVAKRKLLLSGDIELNPGPVQNDNSKTINLIDSNRLLELRLHQLGLRPFDVGGAGDCFFRAMSHQLYSDPKHHLYIRAAGIKYMEENPERFIESSTENSWMQYLKNMSIQGTWCDGLIIQAVADKLNLRINIVESNPTFAEVNVIETVYAPQESCTIFLGHVNETHYVSTLPYDVQSNSSLIQHPALERLQETEIIRQSSLEKERENKKRKRLQETESERQSRLEKDRENKKRKRLQETESERQSRLKRERENKKTKRLQKTESERQSTCRLEKDRENKKRKTSKENQQDYLKEFDVLKNGKIHEQDWAKLNIAKFHKSLKFSTYQCTICKEAWPLKSKPRSPDSYICLRCSQDKKSPKKFSVENSMIPSPVPQQLQDLTQIEEMLIARALPIMRVYIKPGGQRGYSGHCINLPQNVKELASSLPRYPRDLSVFIVKVKGKENTFKDVTVRRQKVHDALLWLIENNSHYAELKINIESLNSLPENGVPSDLLTVETEDQIVSDESVEPDLGQPTDNPTEDTVYNESTQMSSFLPVGEQQKQEIEALRNDLHVSAEEPMEWPTVDDEPLNEYQTAYLATMAFPTLFPDGKGDPTNQALLRDVSLQERIKHLIKFAENCNGKWVYRFASHPRFSYWAFNMIQRKRILQQSGIFLKQNPGEAHLSIDELREMAASNNSAAFMSKVSRYVANLSGTNAYWHKVREDLKAVITTVGAPTFFFTFSSADMHWPELHALFGTNTDAITSDNRRQHVINNPHIVDWFFTQRLDSFVKHWLYDTLDATWHWYRYEYQGRGSIHCHGTAKLNNDPGLCQLTETALKGFLAQKYKNENNAPDTTELDQNIEAGKKAAETACQYVDWLLSTVNPMPPEEDTWVRPPVHPCQKHHEDIPDYEQESDFIDLLNTVQRHTRCSTNYCLRKKHNESDLKCRFHFPFEHCLKTKLEFEEIHSKSDQVQYRAKIVTERNDSRLNNNQQLQLQGWRANCDIQVIIDHYACVEYLTKYAAKTEPRSALVTQAFNSIVQNVGNSSDPHKAIKKVIMKTIGERDYAAQETMHHLLSLKLYSSTFNVIPVSLNGSRRVHVKDGDICTDNSLLDVYANREQYDNSADVMDLNFVQFATKYKVVNKKLSKLPHNIIPRIFPTYSCNPKGQKFPLYCKYQLLRYRPWKITQDNAWGHQEASDETLINSWQEFLHTPYAQTHVPDWFDKLQSVIHSQAEPDVEPVELQNIDTRDEWMILSDLHTPFQNSEQNSDMIHYWHQDRAKYTNQQIGEMPTWIKTKKEQDNVTCEHYEVVDVNTFSEMQQLGYDIVKSHFDNDSPEKDPLFLIIVGVAGTGKSYLINAIRSLLQNKCAVTAPTGKAAYNIRGVTIHSLLKLPVGSRGHQDLKGQSLCRLQESLSAIDYILIDEYSMLGQVTFGWIDKRCKQATGFHNKVLGGKSLILIGDPAQLPPVADKPIYHTRPSNIVGEQGYQTYKMFDKVVKLTVNQRVQGMTPEQVQFRDMLLRLRKGDSQEKDWRLLLSRQPSQISDLTEFEDAMRLFYTKEQVANYNSKQLTKLQQPVACINARHSSAVAKKMNPDDMSGLEQIVFLAKGAKVMLTMNLWPRIGLCNGATGTVVDFIYEINHQPPDLPIAVIVQFDDYRGPSLSQTEPLQVPICPITVLSQSSNTRHERQQLPLRLAWALTIHKSQGLTLPKSWIDIGKSERTAGITYVAISRVKSLSTCVIEPMTFERLTSFKSSASLQFKLKEELRLDNVAHATYHAFHRP